MKKLTQNIAAKTFFKWISVALILILSSAGTLFSAPALPVQAQSIERKIYDAALALHRDNVKTESYTYWIGGDIGIARTSIGNLKIGAAMPSFNFTVFGTKNKLNDQTLEAPYIMNFWASWCPPCQDEFPLLASEAAANKFPVPFIFVASNDVKQDTQLFLMKQPAGLTMLADERGRFSKVNDVPYIPYTLLVDAKGNIQAVHVGGISKVGVEFFQLVAANPGIGKFDRKQPEKFPGSDSNSAAIPIPSPAV